MFKIVIAETSKIKLNLLIDLTDVAVMFIKFVRHVKETILIRVILINGGEKVRRRRKDVVHEDENGLFRGEMDTLA